MRAKLFLPALLLAIASTAFAQQPVTSAKPAVQQQAAKLTPEQQALQAQLDQMGKPLVQAAAQIAQMVDQHTTGIVWDNASPVGKAASPRAAFVKQIDADRTSLGAVKSRKLAGVTGSLSKGGATPAGTYINVTFATQFGTNPQPVRELVSFHLDSDQKWRVSGYTLR
jgi:hypothetical protein